MRKEKESEGTGWSMEGGSLPGVGIGTYSYVTLVQWNIFDEKPIFCDDLSLPSHTKGTQADPTIRGFLLKQDDPNQKSPGDPRALIWDHPFLL